MKPYILPTTYYILKVTLILLLGLVCLILPLAAYAQEYYLDADEDCLPDEWEIEYFGNISQVSPDQTFTFKERVRAQYGYVVFEKTTDGRITRLPFWVWIETNTAASIDDLRELGHNVIDTMKYWKQAGATGVIFSTTEWYIRSNSNNHEALVDPLHDEADRLGLDIVFGVKLSSYPSGMGELVYLLNDIDNGVKDIDSLTPEEQTILATAPAVCDSILTPATFGQLKADMEGILTLTGTNRWIMENETALETIYYSIKYAGYEWTEARRQTAHTAISILAGSEKLATLDLWDPVYRNEVPETPGQAAAYEFFNSLTRDFINTFGERIKPIHGLIYYYSKRGRDNPTFNQLNGLSTTDREIINQYQSLGAKHINMHHTITAYPSCYGDNTRRLYRTPDLFYQDIPFFYGKTMDEFNFDFNEMLLYPGYNNCEIEARKAVEYLMEIGRLVDYIGDLDNADPYSLEEQVTFDSDADGIPNSTDPDDDNDGYSDEDELDYGSGPLEAGSYPKDTDHDFLSDLEEARRRTDPNNPDTDGDGFLDGQDADPLNPNIGDEVFGDVTGDGLVNIADVQACVNIILFTEIRPDWLERADVTEADDQPGRHVNIHDLTTIILIKNGS